MNETAIDESIIITDPICSAHSEEHLTFNRKLASYLTPNRKVIWVGEDEYGKALFQSEVTHKSIKYQNFGAMEAVRRYWHTFRTIRNSKQAKTIFFLAIDNSLFPIFCLLFLRTLASRRSVCILHNNLDGLTMSAWKLALLRFAGRITKIEFVVLTETMKRIADEMLKTQTTLLYHPFFDFSANDHCDSETLTFLTAGRQAKAFIEGDEISDFLSACHEVPSRKVKLQLILPSGTPYEEIQDDRVDIKATVGFVSNATYQAFFKQCDFFLFPEMEGGNLRASGTLMDALSFEKIFVAPAEGHFLEYADCGILYPRDGFKSAMKKAISMDAQEVGRMRNAIVNRRAFVEEFNSKVLDSFFK